MTILIHADFVALSVKGLQALAGFLSGGTAPARSESKAAAATRVCKLLAMEPDPATVIGNMPAFLRTRRFADDATILDGMLTAPHGTAPVVAPVPVVDAPAPVVSWPQAVDVDAVDGVQNDFAAESAPAPVAPVVSVPVPPAMSPIDAWHARVGAAVAAAKNRKAAVVATVAKPRAAGGPPALPKPGTKTRAVFDAMSAPGGVSNKECCEMTGIWASWAVDGRKFADRYGMFFRNVRDGRGVRFYLSATPFVDDAAPAESGPDVCVASNVPGAVGAPMPESAPESDIPYGARMDDTTADCMA